MTTHSGEKKHNCAHNATIQPINGNLQRHIMKIGIFNIGLWGQENQLVKNLDWLAASPLLHSWAHQDKPNKI